VTIVDGLDLPVDRLRQLAKELKQVCGTGGTVKQGMIEIQGDHRDRIVDELTRRGYAAKRAGG
jgi:translation initiation factor 1